MALPLLIAAVRALEPFQDLRRQLEVLDPAVVVTLGRHVRLK